ncbi:MAG: hypothetical protein HOH69_02275 [Gammaproteobacteria bacterium]|nr:hypothetical protein [Gammaproteobacteria bacterium]
MTKPEHAFDPALGLQFARQLEASQSLGNSSAIDIDARQLFYQLNQSGNNQEVMPAAHHFVTQQLNKASQAYMSLQATNDSQESIAGLQAPAIIPLTEGLQGESDFYQGLNQLAAVHLTQPCWLENISQIGSSQADTTVTVMAVYLQLTGAEQQGANIQQLYRALLLSSGRNTPMLHSFEYSKQTGGLAEVFNFASIQLALARFPRVLFAEILGFTLAYCQAPVLLEICFPDHLLARSLFNLHKQQAQQCAPVLHTCIANYLGLFSQQSEQLWQRICGGFWLYHTQMQSCRDRLQHVLQAPVSAHQGFADLLQQKAAAAMGHHQKVAIQGKTLDDWFAGLPENSDQFLQALIQSGYVNQKNPADSPLLKLFDFKGPMFGVLDQSELDIVKNWLGSELNEHTTEVVKEPEKSFANALVQIPVINKAQKKYAKLCNRELYYYLVNADLFPDVLPTARAKVQYSLQACRWFNPLPFKNYSHQRFDHYIDTIYQQEVDAYQPLQGKPKISREAYVWGLEQIAPMILIDGCWLQNSLALKNLNPEICEILFNIYCDEIGNGRLAQNHPHIFQQLLESISIQVPPVYSEAFVKSPGFINSAFDLPVYMLSLSSFSVEFLPELLGLNMAIELSGLGKSYMSLVDDWNYWGIDPSIANIHISIDNAASGHTFLAKKAIKIYMDEVLNNSADRVVVDQHWRRIYSGYTSLRFVGRRFKLALPIGYLWNKFSVKNR